MSGGGCGDILASLERSGECGGGFLFLERNLGSELKWLW